MRRGSWAIAASLLLGAGTCALAVPARAAGDQVVTGGAADRLAGLFGSAPSQAGGGVSGWHSVASPAPSARVGVGADVIHTAHFRFGPLAAYQPSFIASLQSGGRSGRVRVGAFAQYAYKSLSVRADALQGLIGEPEIEVGFGYGAKLAPDVSLSLGPNVTWGSSLTNTGLPGIPSLGSPGLTPGLSGFQAGFQDVGASVEFNWKFFDDWNLIGFAGARAPLHSPPAATAATVSRYFTGISLGYHF